MALVVFKDVSMFACPCLVPDQRSLSCLLIKLYFYLFSWVRGSLFWGGGEGGVSACSSWGMQGAPVSMLPETGVSAGVCRGV